MATPQQRTMSARKGLLTKESTYVDMVIEERNYEDMVAERDKLKDLYQRFYLAHEEHHGTLIEESDIVSSEDYLQNVQTMYTLNLKKLNGAMDLIEAKQTKPTIQPVIEQDSLTGSVNTLARLMNLPPLKLDTFSGAPDEYDVFVSTFEEVVGRITTDPAAKLIRLKSHVSGIAADAIKSCRTQDGAEAYTRAMKILYERFGSPHIICNSIISGLKDGTSVHTPSELRSFADELANAEITLKGKDMFSEVDTQNNIVHICRRLQPQLRYKWRDTVMKEKRATSVYLKFSDFVQFVQDQADVVNDPIYGEDALFVSTDKLAKNKRLLTGFASATMDGDTPNRSQTFNQQKPNICLLCKENHKLFYCPRFIDMSVNERLVYVRNNALCSNCLISGHKALECRKPFVCKINNCNQKHSKLLHVLVPVSTNRCVVSSNDTNIYMPIVPVVVNDEFCTYALLDTGSSNSFCTRSLMTKLNLICPKLSYQLNTLHGSGSQRTEVATLKMSSRDGQESILMKNVFVTEHIPIESCDIDVGNYPHLKDLSFSCSGSVDILIGQDNPAALVPLEVRIGPKGTPFAIHTIMGWALNGTSAPSPAGRRITSNFVSSSVLENKINRLCEIEEEGILNIPVELSTEYREVLDLGDAKCEIVDQHFQLPIPSKAPEEYGPVHVARNRVESLYKSLKGKYMVKTYNKQIDDMVLDEYTKSVHQSPAKYWYLPTHAVLKKDKHSLQIVLGCAHTYNRITLNGSCYEGPNLIWISYDVLLRLLQRHSEVMVDIALMYNQAKILTLADMSGLRSPVLLRTYRSECNYVSPLMSTTSCV